MGFEHKIIELVGSLPTINQMIRKTYSTHPDSYNAWNNYLTTEIIKLSDNYSREALIHLIAHHPYIEQFIKQENKEVIENLYNIVDKLAQQEIFFEQHIAQFTEHHYVLLIANHNDIYGSSHALYFDDLFFSFSDNQMSLKRTKWLLECIQGKKHITEINNHQALTHYISEHEKFPLWLHDLPFLDIPLKSNQTKRIIT